jgi:predicted small secreted protein
MDGYYSIFLIKFINMKRVLFGLVIFFSLSTMITLSSCNTNGGNGNNSIGTQDNEDLVYVCVSKGSYAYHCDPDCYYYNRCTHETKAITKEDAIAENRKPCSKCCK